nr:MAG TPA: hypothetical protein [Bacteriophage sp.]
MQAAHVERWWAVCHISILERKRTCQTISF